MSPARLYRVSAVIIRQRNLGEADRVVALLTRERGKLSAVAKGVKKPRSKLAGNLQLFYHARVTLASGRSLDIITQVQPLETFLHLREDIARFSYASYLSELADALTEEDAPDEVVYELLVLALRALDGGGDAATVARAFELKLLTHLGYGPEVQACVACATAVRGHGAGFSAAEGGILCQRCRRAVGAGALSAEAARALRELISVPMDELAKRRLKAGVGEELEQVMRAFVDRQLERPLKSASLLK